MNKLEQNMLSDEALNAVSGGLIDYDTGKTIRYTVQSGDSLKSIAAKFGCDWVFLFTFNQAVIKNPDHIEAGWTLQIPQE